MDRQTAYGWLRIAGSALALVAIALAVVVFVGPHQEDVVDAVRELGPAAPIAGAIIYALLVTILMPGTVLAITAGIVFGPFIGAAVAVVGAALGSSASFALSRTIARGHVERVAGAYGERLDAWLEHHGTMAFAYIRVVPALPWAAVDYAAGMTGVGYKQFFAGSVLGFLPGGFAYAAFGGTAGDPASIQFMLAVALLVFVIVGGWLLQRRLGPNATGGR